MIEGRVFEWIISHPNVNLLCVSSSVVNVLNPESNKNVATKNVNGYLH